jgi:microcystin degradation protein MlrC
VIPFFKGTRTNLGGFIAAMEEEDFEIIPVIAASATPGGLVTKEMFESTKSEIVEAIKNTVNIDGILLDLHGAMVSENEPDGEGALLKAIREAAGDKMPIISTPYENYPHTDCFERGYEAGKCIARIIRGELSPIMRLRQIPILAHTIETSKTPHVELLSSPDVCHGYH